MTRPESAGTIPLLIFSSWAEQLRRWTVRQFRAMVAGEIEWDDASFGWLTKQADAVVLKADFGVQFDIENPNGVEQFQVTGKGLPNWTDLIGASSAEPHT
jgi:hypothetical protein